MDCVRWESEGCDGVACVGENLADGAGEEFFVVDHDEACGDVRLRGDWGSRVFFWAGGFIEREEDGEGATESGFGIDRDGALRVLDEVFHDEQPHAGAFSTGLSTEKGLEDAGTNFVRDSRSGVLHLEKHVGNFFEGVATGEVLGRWDLFAEMHRNRARFAIERVPCVRDEVQHDLMDFVLVDSNHGKVGFCGNREVNRAGNRRFDEVQRLADGGFGMAGGAVLRDAVGVAEDLVGKFAAASCSFDDVGVAVGVGGLSGKPAKLGVSDNSAQDIVDVVNDAAAEHSDISQAIRVHHFVSVSFDFRAEVEDFCAESSDEGFEVAEVETLRRGEGDLLRGEREEVGELDEQGILVAVGGDDAGGTGVAERDLVGDVGEDGGEDGDGNFRTGFAEGAKQGDGVGIRQDVRAENRVGWGCGNTEQGGCAGVLGGDAVSEVLNGFGDAV